MAGGCGGITNKFSKTSLLERYKGSDGDLYLKTSSSNFKIVHYTDEACDYELIYFNFLSNIILLGRHLYMLYNNITCFNVPVIEWTSV